MVVLGGMGSIWGVVLGSLVLSGINTYLLPKLDLSLIASGIYGLLLVVMVVLRPQGADAGSCDDPPMTKTRIGLAGYGFGGRYLPRAAAGGR